MNSTTIADDRSSYWNSYYGSVGAKLQLPSQFATFVAGEIGESARIVELGSGSGRDALFFATYGHHVIGVDQSVEAVALCSGLAQERGLDASFVASPIDASDLAEQIGTSERRTVVYARFFLHAVTDVEELALLRLAAAVTRPGDRLALEYRTDRDASGTKVTGAHYRRFVRPADFHAHAVTHGFGVDYEVQGFGFAKYKDDDAFVARDLLTRR